MHCHSVPITGHPSKWIAVLTSSVPDAGMDVELNATVVDLPPGVRTKRLETKTGRATFRTKLPNTTQANVPPGLGSKCPPTKKSTTPTHFASASFFPVRT